MSILKKLIVVGLLGSVLGVGPLQANKDAAHSGLKKHKNKKHCNADLTEVQKQERKAANAKRKADHQAMLDKMSPDELVKYKLDCKAKRAEKKSAKEAAMTPEQKTARDKKREDKKVARAAKKEAAMTSEQKADRDKKRTAKKKHKKQSDQSLLVVEQTPELV